MKIFNIHIEFDSKVFCKRVEDYIEKKQKAYVCVVDANVITIAQKDMNYRKIVNEASINTCDGSSIAKMANSIYGTHYSALDVPFVSVDKFDYPTIAEQINKLRPDIIWVSLGSPKQETFISNIFPYIKQGVLFGIGAAFNFYTGDLHNNKKEIRGLRFIWLERIFKEPKKQLGRVGKFLLMVPKMYIEEYRKSKK